MSFIDKVIGAVSPKAAFERARYQYLAKLMGDEQRKFEAAGGGRRLKNWRPGNTTQNQEIEMGIDALRARSRDLVRNNPYAFRAIQGLSNNVVGTGIKPAIVGTSETAAKNAKKLWEEFANSTDCDFDGLLNFYGIMRLVMRTVGESGECLILRRRNASKKIPIEFQVLEPEFIDSSRSTTIIEGQPFTMLGVQFDKDGRKTGYWLFDRNPNDNYYAKSRFVPVSDVIHVFEVLRPGQVRGIPFGVSSFVRLKDFDDYEDAQLVRQKIAACFSVFVGDFGANADPLSKQTQNADGSMTERVEPGIIQHLPAGKTVTFGNPPAAEGYEPYTKKVLQGIAAGYSGTYEMITGDLSNVNFSSGRMGWIEAARNYEALQEFMMVPMFCNKAWAWFVDAAFLSGNLRNRNVSVSWTPPRREMIDPVKETNAMIEQVKAGLISWPEALRLMGYDPDMTLSEIDEWVKKIDSMGLVLSSDARNDLKNALSTGTDSTGDTGNKKVGKNDNQN